MLPFFPAPYPDELLFSICARYHERSCNILYSHTAQDLFGSKTATSVALFPSNLNHLCSQLHPNSLIKPDMLIAGHTLFPLYKPFLPKRRADAAVASMKNSSNGPDCVRASGMLRFGLLAERNFKLCLECVAEDSDEFGEAYWHRDHQHFGVLTCYRHGSLLVDTGLPLAQSMNRRQFYLPDQLHSKGTVRTISPRDREHVRYITEAVHWLLHNQVPDNSMEILHRNYDRLLIDQGYAHAWSSIMSHRKVTAAFIKFYGKRFLELMSSGFSSASTENWLVKLLKESDTVTDPLRHILAIRFLGEEVPNMLSEELAR